MKLLLTGQLTKLILGFLDKNKKVKSENKVYFPTYFGVIGIVFSLLCGLGVYFTVKLGAPIIITIIAGTFLLPGLAMIIVWLNKRIDFDEEGFTYRSFWRIKKRYTYEQITSYWGDGSYSFFVRDKKIKVDMIMCNSREFFEFANKKYKLIHGSLAIPKGKKKDIFNNNLNNPSEFIAVFVLVAMGISVYIGIGIFMYFDFLPLNEGTKATLIIYAALCVFLILLFGLFSVMFVLVARNPEKFNPKTVKFFIKPSSLVGYEKTRKQTRKRKYKK